MPISAASKSLVVNLTDANPDIGAGSIVPAGFYIGIIKDITDTPSKKSAGAMQLEIHVEVADGPFKGGDVMTWGGIAGGDDAKADRDRLASVMKSVGYPDSSIKTNLQVGQLEPALLGKTVYFQRVEGAKKPEEKYAPLYTNFFTAEVWAKKKSEHAANPRPVATVAFGAVVPQPAFVPAPAAAAAPIPAPGGFAFNAPPAAAPAPSPAAPNGALGSLLGTLPAFTQA
jgi:hypothetical protein